MNLSVDIVGYRLSINLSSIIVDLSLQVFCFWTDKSTYRLESLKDVLNDRLDNLMWSTMWIHRLNLKIYQSPITSQLHKWSKVNCSMRREFYV